MSGGKQKPAKAERVTGVGRRRRGRIATVCLLKPRSQQLQQCPRRWVGGPGRLPAVRRVEQGWPTPTTPRWSWGRHPRTPTWPRCSTPWVRCWTAAACRHRRWVPAVARLGTGVREAAAGRGGAHRLVRSSAKPPLAGCRRAGPGRQPARHGHPAPARQDRRHRRPRPPPVWCLPVGRPRSPRPAMGRWRWPGRSSLPRTRRSSPAPRRPTSSRPCWWRPTRRCGSRCLG